MNTSINYGDNVHDKLFSLLLFISIKILLPNMNFDILSFTTECYFKKSILMYNKKNPYNTIANDILSHDTL